MAGNIINVIAGGDSKATPNNLVNIAMSQPGPAGSGINALLKNYRIAAQLPSLSGAASIDMVNGNIIQPTLAGDVTSVAVTGWAPSGFESKLVFYVKQGATPYTINGWPAEVVWVGGVAPAYSAVQGEVDIIVLATVDGGATILGFYIGRAS